MICSTLALLWKSQYFQRPIYKPVEDVWWSLYCENIKPLSIFTKKLHRRCLHGFWIQLCFLKTLQTFFLKDFSYEAPWNLFNLIIFSKRFIKHAEHLIKKTIFFPCSNARDVPVKFYITTSLYQLFFKPVKIFAVLSMLIVILI